MAKVERQWVPSKSAHPRTTISGRLASVSKWVLRVQRRLGLSTSQRGKSRGVSEGDGRRQAMREKGENEIWGFYDFETQMEDWEELRNWGISSFPNLANA
ncbi:hypothetical protein TB1_025020 [Malus domestica]